MGTLILHAYYKHILNTFMVSIAVFGLCGCLSNTSTKPIQTSTEYVQSSSSVMALSSVTFDENSVFPDLNTPVKVALNAAEEEEKGCSFSSMQRKHTLGYEIDPSRHITFKASPSFDVWSMGDFKMKASIRFTKSIGGEALKRPCTFGSGYYGIVPYLTNNTDTLSAITNPAAIKSMIQEKMDERKGRKSKRDNDI
jgi:hypothetical protein